MGKRVDFSARTVVAGDPSLNLNEVGIPKKMATNLTFPEIVTKNNIEKMK
jgi:DNA-directed RNA polymerase II subunit RPB1